MGRPTKITPEQMEPYFEGLRLGMSKERASELADVTHPTILKARTFLWFATAEKNAQAECIQRRLDLIRQAGQGGFVTTRRTTVNQRTGVETTEESFARPEWTANAWVLERRFPDDFAKKDNEALSKLLNILVGKSGSNPV